MKDVRTKLRKIGPHPLVRKISALVQTSPHLSVWTHHKYKKNPEFFTTKSADIGFWRTPTCP